MELNEYQEKAMTTCMESSHNFSYMFCNLVGEVGEIASKVAKAIRKEQAVIEYNELILEHVSNEERKDMEKELGDILWQLAGLCEVFGADFESVAKQNLEKLASRKNRGVIDGSGDNR